GYCGKSRLVSRSDTYFFRWVTVAARYASVGKASRLTSSAGGKPGRLTYLSRWSSVKGSYYLKAQNTTEPGTIAVPVLKTRCFYLLGVSKPFRFALGRRGKAGRL